MTKFYAVRKGKKKGIFNTWAECKESVEGFSNAEYKSFHSIEEAQSFLNANDSTEPSKQQKNFQKKTIKAYVDGSYSKQLERFAYGCVLLDGENIKTLSGTGISQGDSNLWNVSGELQGAIKAIEWSIENKFEHIIIYYDYEGIAKWATGEWRAKKEETKQYVIAIEKYKKIITIEFNKVKAHSGDKYNEEADRLAKEAFLIDRSKENQIEEEPSKDKALILFENIISSEMEIKNPVCFSYKKYVLTESKLKKFVKEYWKKSGNKINDIESFKVDFDYKEGLLTWQYTKKDGDKIDFKLLIN